MSHELKQFFFSGSSFAVGVGIAALIVWWFAP